MKKIEYGTEYLDHLKDSVHDLSDDNKELRKEIERLNNIINEVRELCLMFARGRLERTNYDDILEVIDKVGVDKE